MGRQPGLKWKSLGLKGARRLGAGAVAHHAPALSPDGARLLFAAGEGSDGAWVLCDRRGRVARVLPGPAVGGAAIAVGGALAFTRALRPAPEIWYTPSETLPPVRLLGGDGARYGEPAFSPDGRMLACVVATERAPARILLVDLESLARREVVRGADADGTREDARPSFSPDGAWLFFTGRSGGEVAIYCQASDGRTPPAPLCSGVAAVAALPSLLLVERPVAGDAAGASRLHAVELEGREVARERELDESDAREPALAWGAERPRLAWVTLVDGKREIVSARLRGVTPVVALDDDLDHDDHEYDHDRDADHDDDDHPQLVATQERAP